MVAPRDSKCFYVGTPLAAFLSKPVPAIYPNGSCEVFLVCES